MEQQKNTLPKGKRKGELGRSATNPILTRSRQEAYWYLELLQKRDWDDKIEQQPDTEDGLMHVIVYWKGGKRGRNLYFNCHSSETSACWPDGFCFQSCFADYAYGNNTAQNLALAREIAALPLSCRLEDAVPFDNVKELGQAAVRLLRWKEISTYAEGGDRGALERLAAQLYDLECKSIGLYNLLEREGDAPVSWREWSVKFRRHSGMLEPVRQANSTCFHNAALPEELKVFASKVLDEYIVAEL